MGRQKAKEAEKDKEKRREDEWRAYDEQYQQQRDAAAENSDEEHDGVEEVAWECVVCRRCNVSSASCCGKCFTPRGYNGSNLHNIKRSKAAAAAAAAAAADEGAGEGADGEYEYDQDWEAAGWEWRDGAWHAKDQGEEHAAAWREQRDPSGNLYYVHTVTGESQWIPPPWIDQLDAESGTVYYLNTRTNETSWERPPEFVPIVREGEQHAAGEQ